MKRLLLFLLILFSIQAIGQTINPQMEVLILPKYIQGNSGTRFETGFGTPTVYRAKITGLTPFATYRYENKVVNAFTASSGGGSKFHYILPPANVPPGTINYTPGDFYKAPTATGNSGDTNGAIGDLSGYYGLLTADKDGSYTGWFIQETIKYNGKEGVFFRISLNDPNAAPDKIGWIAYMMHSPADQPIYTLGTSAKDNTAEEIFFGTAIRSTPTQGAAKNIVLLYDNVEGTGRPISTTYIENDGVEGTLYAGSAANVSGQAAFYKNNVDGVQGAWGGIIVNTDAKGIRRIEQRSLADGTLIGYNTSEDGTWPDGENPGGTVSTANTALGANAAGNIAIVIDGSKVTLAPAKSPQTVTFTNIFPATFKVGDPDFVLSASSTAGLNTFQYTATPEGILEITGNTVKIIGHGTAVITVTEPGNTVTAAGTATQSITVDAIAQPITGLPATLDAIYGDGNITLAATGGASGNPIIYTSDDKNIAEIVNSNQVLIKTPGLVTIRANQSGNALYADAPEVNTALTISKASLDVIAENKTKIFGVANPEATFAYGNFKNADNETAISGTPVLTIAANETSAAGEYAIDIDVSPLSSDKYTFNPIKGKLTIENKLEQEIVLTTFPSTATYGNQPLPFKVKSTSANPVIFSSSNPAAAIVEKNAIGEWTLKITGAGQADITASQGGDAVYIPGSTKQRVVVSKAPLMIIAEDKAKLTGEADPVFTVRYQGLVNNDQPNQLSGTLSFDKQPDGADYFIIPSGLTAANYTITYVNGKLTSGTVAFAAMNKTYGDAPFNPSAANSEGQTPVYLIANTAVAALNSNGTIEIKGAGTTEITAAFPSGATSSALLKVDQKEVTITPDPQTRVYAQPNPQLTVNYAGFVYGENENVLSTKPKLSTSAVPNSPVGAYFITAAGAAAANYKFSYQSNTLTVTKADLNFTFNDLPAVTYGDAAFTPAITSEFGAQPVLSSDNTSVAVIENGKVKITGAGTANITAVFNSTGDYTGGKAAQLLLVNKRNLVVRTDSKSRLYGQANPALTGTYEGFVNGETLTSISAPAVFTTDATPLSPAGSYTISGTAASALNYSFTYETGILNIGKAILTVTADNKTRAYGIENPAFTFRYTGFVNSEDASVLDNPALANTIATPATLIGAYPIVPSGASDENYSFNYVNGTLTITTTGRTIVFDPLPLKFVGDEDFAPSATLSSGETALFTSGDETIATIVDNKIHFVGVGTVLITATAPVNTGYSTRPAFSQYMLVRKAQQTITFENTPVLSTDGKSYTLKATSTSGLPVTFTVSNPAFATLDGAVIKGLRIGKVQVVANQTGDSRYEAARSVEQTVQIGDISGVDMIIHPALSINGDGLNEFLSIDGIKEFPYNKVTIIDRNGLKVFEIEGYDNDQVVFTGKSKSGALLPQGTYFCLIKYFVNSKVKSKTGYFILKY